MQKKDLEKIYLFSLNNILIVELKYKEKLTFIKRADSQVGSQSPVGVENLRSKEGSIPVEVREMLKCHEE